jgi:hypothetical protein
MAWKRSTVRTRPGPPKFLIYLRRFLGAAGLGAPPEPRLRHRPLSVTAVLTIFTHRIIASRNVMRFEPMIPGVLFASAVIAAADQSPVTFSKDVLPVLQKSCQGCHRPGEAAPFSLLTYEGAKPWAKAIREAVLLRKMPPQRCGRNMTPPSPATNKPSQWPPRRTQLLGPGWARLTRIRASWPTPLMRSTRFSPTPTISPEIRSVVQAKKDEVAKRKGGISKAPGQ